MPFLDSGDPPWTAVARFHPSDLSADMPHRLHISPPLPPPTPLTSSPLRNSFLSCCRCFRCCFCRRRRCCCCCCCCCCCSQVSTAAAAAHRYPLLPLLLLPPLLLAHRYPLLLLPGIHCARRCPCQPSLSWGRLWETAPCKKVRQRPCTLVRLNLCTIVRCNVYTIVRGAIV